MGKVNDRGSSLLAKKSRQSGELDGTGKRILFACCCMKLCTGGLAPNGTVNIFYSYIAEDWGVSVSTIALMNTIMCFVTMLATPYMGHKMNQESPKRVVQISFLIGICGYLFCAVATSPQWLYLCGAMIGLANACLTYSAIPFFINGWFRSNIGLYISAATASQAFGKILVSPWCSKLITQAGWRIGYLVFGSVSAIIFLSITAIFLKDPPKAERKKDNERKHWRSLNIPGEETLTKSYKYKILGLIGIGTALSGYCLSVSTSVVAIAKTSNALSGEDAGFAASAIAIGMLAGEPLMGWMLDRTQRFWRPVLLFSSIQAAGMIVMANIYAMPQMALMGSLLIGFGIGSNATVMVPYVARKAFGPSAYPIYFPKLVTCLSAANACSSYLTNFFYDVYDSYAVILYIMAGMSVLNATAIFAVYQFMKAEQAKQK